MKQRYSVFLRPWGVFYYEDHQTGKQETLKTRDKDEAYRLVAAKNENEDAPPPPRLHLDRVRFAMGWHLRITLGVCMSGFEPGQQSPDHLLGLSAIVQAWL